VLLLGRFTESRTKDLERLPKELRKPIVFNFDKPETKELHRDGQAARRPVPLP